MAQRGAAASAALKRKPTEEFPDDTQFQRHESTKEGLQPSQSRIFGRESETEIIHTPSRHLRLLEEEVALTQRLEDLETLWDKRRTKLANELKDAEQRRLQEEKLLDSMMSEDDQLPPEVGPPGPHVLRWVDGSLYSCACSTVIAANLGVMARETQDPSSKESLRPLDNAFLVWYLLELVLKTCLHQRGWFCGNFFVIWWNWLDLLIVVSGIVEQWLIPGLEWLDVMPQSKHHVSFTGLRCLRILRVFRVFRVLKIARHLVASDLSWTEGNYFQSFIMAVITMNTVLLGIELDLPWDGWKYVEQVFLLIYVFEITVRIKRWGLQFFWHEKDMGWNLMDFFIVLAAVMDQWFLPMVDFVHVLLFKEKLNDHGSGATTVVMLLRIMRLFRILRLVRLLRAVKPLFRLLMGILEAVQAMLWVLTLTVIILYACAILVTSLIGHGIIFSGGVVPEEAHGLFSNVPQSMFMLFKLMNDDQSVMDPILFSTPARIFFVAFMVVTNWAILAVLTSVMSESMISATHRNIEADTLEKMNSDRERRIYRLKNLFFDLDKSGDGFVDESEFNMVLEDSTLAVELCDISGLTKRDLNELFDFLCEEDNGRRRIRYVDFVHSLQIEGEAVVERSLFRLEKEVRKLENRLTLHIERRVEALFTFLTRTAEENGGNLSMVKLRSDRNENVQANSAAASSPGEGSRVTGRREYVL